jgi:Fe-S cluster assembly iron-binding protein IscA
MEVVAADDTQGRAGGSLSPRVPGSRAEAMVGQDGHAAMGIEVTEEAASVLRRSLELGGIESDAAGIRLRAARGLGGGIDVQVELAESPLENETIVEAEGIRLFVDPEVTRALPEAVVALEPQHEVVVVRPADHAPGEEAGP